MKLTPEYADDKAEYRVISANREDPERANAGLRKLSSQFTGKLILRDIVHCQRKLQYVRLKRDVIFFESEESKERRRTRAVRAQNTAIRWIARISRVRVVGRKSYVHFICFEAKSNSFGDALSRSLGLLPYATVKVAF
jgi:hypothetical protein